MPAGHTIRSTVPSRACCAFPLVLQLSINFHRCLPPAPPYLLEPLPPFPRASSKVLTRTLVGDKSINLLMPTFPTIADWERRIRIVHAMWEAHSSLPISPLSSNNQGRVLTELPSPQGSDALMLSSYHCGGCHPGPV